MKLLTFFILLISISISTLNNLFIIIIGLILIALLRAGELGSIAGSWYAAILFLIFIRGTLVIFGYMVSISRNQVGNIPTWLILLSPLYFLLPSSTRKTFRDFEVTVSKIIMSENIIRYFIMVIFLLLILISVVVITYKAPKPLRGFN